MDHSELTFALQARRLAFERMNDAARKECNGTMETLDADFTKAFAAQDFKEHLIGVLKDATSTAETIRGMQPG